MIKNYSIKTKILISFKQAGPAFVFNMGLLDHRTYKLLILTMMELSVNFDNFQSLIPKSQNNFTRIALSKHLATIYAMYVFI